MSHGSSDGLKFRRRATSVELDESPSTNCSRDARKLRETDRSFSGAIDATNQPPEEAQPATEEPTPEEKRKKFWRSFKTRARAATLMMIAFGVIVWAGHMCVSVR